MTKFVLIGAAGYIAPRHMAAIKAVGGDLVAVLDPHDSVGVLDSYFPNCCYFREFERFDRFCCKQAGIDYVVVCSPNYLHDAHIRFGLRVAPRVICEKPVVLNERNLDQLLCEQSVFLNNSRVNCILQLRLHPLVKAIYPRGQNEVVINYSTPRGAWYNYSWKADEAKSGGLITNIGSHLFDLCGLLFGDFQRVEHLDLLRGGRTIVGRVHYETAKVTFTLTIDRIFDKTRSFEVNGDTYDFSKDFETLHEDSYNAILEGNGFTMEDARQGVRACETIRRQLR